MISELKSVSGAARGRLWRSVLLVVGVVLGGAIVVPGALPVAALAGLWNDAVDVPGLKALNTNNGAFVSSVSCAAPGECSATGSYSDADGRQGFVVSQSAGVWGSTVAIPGLKALNTNGFASVSSVSCAAPGECSATGSYSDADGFQGFVVSQSAGVWGSAVATPGLKALNTNNNAGVNLVSCAAPGECSATGRYSDADGFQGFVVSQSAGVWGSTVDVPGLKALNTNDWAGVNSVSCAAPGECSATGEYHDADGFQGFVVSQTAGVWGSAVAIPGLKALNTSNNGALGSSVSCAAPGECSATGEYNDADGTQGFVVSQTAGAWGSAMAIPGLKALNTSDFNDFAFGSSVSCAAPGECSATGFYTDADGTQVFVVSQTADVWGSAVATPGLKVLNTNNNAGVSSVSCAAPGECSATGFYSDGDGRQGFVVSQTAGVWNDAVAIPGLKALNTNNNAGVSSVSCAAPGECSATGRYQDADGDQGFVVDSWAVPGAPSGVSGVAGDGEVTVSWMGPASDGGSAVTQYSVVASPGGGTCQTTGALTCRVSGLTNGIGYTFTVTATNSVGAGPVSDPSATIVPMSDVADVGTVDPARLLDTRSTGETVDGLFQGAGKVDGGSFIKVQIAGRGGVPADAVGVELNITAIQNEGRGFATLYPCTATPPTASTLNYTPGVNIANATTVALNASGEVCVYTSTTAHYALDVVAFVPAGSDVGTVDPARLLDTRSTGETVDGLFQGAGKVDGGSFIKVQIAGRGGVPADAVGVELNITAIQNEGRGFATLYPCTATPPTASTLNYTPGVNIANATTVALNASGEVCVYTSTTAHYALDVVAFVPAGSDVGTVDPARLLDTRSTGETVDGLFQGAGKVDGGSFIKVQIAGRGGVPADAVGVELNITAIQNEGRGFATLYPCTATPPTASTLNYTPGVNIANATTVALNASGEVCVYTSTTSHYALDVVAHITN